MIKTADFEKQLPPFIAGSEVDKEWLQAVKEITESGGKGRKIIVLDDDPTGTQTVHSIPVYTDWTLETLRTAIKSKYTVVYFLTNSRALTAKQTESLHRELITNLKQAAREGKQEFILISRSDSTLRGHYPLETEVLYRELTDENSGYHIDGELIIPCFFEGGRVTFNDIHYVKTGEGFLPAGESEFAQDPTFGYQSSDLKEWVEEKTKGKYRAADVKSIPLALLRGKKLQEIEEILLSLTGFNKLIVNAVEPKDLKIFLIALSRAMAQGKKYLYRTAASFVQIIGGIQSKPYLTKDDLYPAGSSRKPGLIIVGSYVERTTKQLEALKELPGIHWVEWRVSEAKEEGSLQAEVERVIKEAEKGFQMGRDVCIYTSRDYLRIDHQAGKSEKNLLYSVRVSEGLVRVVQGLKSKPGFLIAKGGITSSDIGVKGLRVKEAFVLGQIRPGITVWKLGTESRFPGLSYIIFPGNVGEKETLKEIVAELR